MRMGSRPRITQASSSKGNSALDVSDLKANGWIIKMKYIKKAQQTAQGNSDRVRSVVKEILSSIETEGERAVAELARKFDKWEGDFILGPEKKKALIDQVPEQVKADIRYAHEQVTDHSRKMGNTGQPNSDSCSSRKDADQHGNF